MNAQARKKAMHIIFQAQHDARHEQTRQDARAWMDEFAGGRCLCPKCVRDDRDFAARAKRYGGDHGQ